MGLLDRIGSWFSGISANVGNGKTNRPEDVVAVKEGLAATGFLRRPRYGFHGYWTRATDDGLRDFQAAAGERVDGWAGPNGPTIRAMQQSFRDTFEMNNRRIGVLGPVDRSQRPRFQDPADLDQHRRNLDRDHGARLRARGRRLWSVDLPPLIATSPKN